MIIYLHGFNSSPLSEKARQLAAYCGRAGETCVVPQLPHHPAQAVRMAEELMQSAGSNVTLVGSSMGGYYATWLCERNRGARAALINPAVKLAGKLADCVGREQKNYHNGETYLFTEDHLRALAALEVAAVEAPQRYLLMVQTGDELLDYREAAAYYAGCESIVEEGGDHSFQHFDRHLPRIIDFHRRAADGKTAPAEQAGGVRT